MSSRGQYISNVQKATLENRAKRHKECAIFYQELKRVLGQANDDIRTKILELQSRPDYAEDERKQTRVDFKEQTIKDLDKFKKDCWDSFVASSEDFFLDSYIKQLGDTEGVFGLGAGFVNINRNAILEAINYPFKGAMWSDRVWNDLDGITNSLRKELIRGIASGESLDVIARRLDKSLINVGQKIKYVTERIIRTEHARILYNVEKRVYKELGVEKVIFEAYLDSKTSKICKSHNNKIFVLGKEPMIPMHPHCRSCYSAYIEEKSLDDWLKKIDEAKKKDSSEGEFKRKGQLIVSEIDKFAKGYRDSRGISIDKVLDGLKKHEFYEDSERMEIFLKAVEEEKRKMNNHEGKVYTAYKTKQFMLQTKDGKYIKVEIPIGEVFEERLGGKYFLNLDKDNKDYDIIVKLLDKVVKNDDRLTGLKYSFDNDELTGGTLGYYTPLADTIVLKDIKGYGSLEELRSTLLHENGHRKHNMNFDVLKRLGVTVSEEDWELMDRYAEAFHKGYGGKSLASVGLPSMTYPVNADRYYENGSINNVKKEIFAEIHSLISDVDNPNYDSNMKALNEYFSGLPELIKKYI